MVIDTVEGGQMTKDLALLIGPEQSGRPPRSSWAPLADNLKKALIEG